MMGEPPSGYDDETTIPRLRLKQLLGNFEDELTTIQKVFEQSVSLEYKEEGKSDYSSQFWAIKETAAELGQEYGFLIEKLIYDYESFKNEPDHAKLEQLFSDVKSLQLLLTG